MSSEGELFERQFGTAWYTEARAGQDGRLRCLRLVRLYFMRTMSRNRKGVMLLERGVKRRKT